MAQLSPQEVMEELQRRGFSYPQAAGIVANFQAESGLRSNINEMEPVVEGSRGGYGLYQLTGPRRRAYEEYVSEQGRDVADPLAQLDFMMEELSGPERRAAEYLYAAETPEEAARAFSKRFLRPGHDNTEYRAKLAKGFAETGNMDAPSLSSDDRRIYAGLVDRAGENPIGDGVGSRIFAEPEEEKEPDYAGVVGAGLNTMQTGDMTGLGNALMAAARRDDGMGLGEGAMANWKKNKDRLGGLFGRFF